jgi:hypothetical protein
MKRHRCPDCGGPLVYGEGCATCPICGFTACGYLGTTSPNPFSAGRQGFPRRRRRPKPRITVSAA